MENRLFHLINSAELNYVMFTSVIRINGVYFYNSVCLISSIGRASDLQSSWFDSWPRGYFPVIIDLGF